MKKLSLLALVAVALTACGEQKPTPEDYSAVESEIQAVSNTGEALSIKALGAAGDYIIELPATDTLVAISKKAKTVTFLSVENPAQYVAEGKCLLNIIPTNTMNAMNTPENNCNFRLFCGTAEDANAEFYAVELCSK